METFFSASRGGGSASMDCPPSDCSHSAALKQRGLDEGAGENLEKMRKRALNRLSGSRKPSIAQANQTPKIMPDITRTSFLASLGLGLTAIALASCASEPASYRPPAQAALAPEPYYGDAPQAASANPGSTGSQQRPSPTAAPLQRGGGELVNLTAANFDAVISQPGTVVLVDFAAVWCGPCRQLEPVIEKIAGDFAGRVIVGRVDVDNDPQLAERYGIDTLPTLAFFKNGQLHTLEVGLMSEQAIAGQLNQLAR